MKSISNQEEIEKDLNCLLDKYHIDKNKYLSPDIEIFSYNTNNVIGNQDMLDLTCPICFNVLNKPISCSSNIICHSFCKECIDKFLIKKKICPVCKQNFEYKANIEIEKLLNKIQFKCLFEKEGCKQIMNYSEYLHHIKECKFENIVYECQIEKFSYSNKNFVKCNFKGNNHVIDNHFKLCAFYNFKCIFCNENIVHINFKDHVENDCKIGIINNEDGNKYIGEKNNKIGEGYGIYSFSDGGKYEGEFRNNTFEGYGIFMTSNGDKYEGQFRNNEYEGIGTFINTNGDIFKGEFKNNKLEGYGIFMTSNGDKYEGEFKNGIFEGFGIYYYSTGNKYVGNFKDGNFEGFGVFYHSNGSKFKGYFKDNELEGNGIFTNSNGDKYEGKMQNGNFEGFGIFYCSNGDKYEGMIINNKFEGYGIYYCSNGDKYKGEFKDNKYEGFGIYCCSNGDKYEGQYKNNTKDGYGILYLKFINMKFKGRWKNDLPDGFGSIIISKTFKFEGNWNYKIVVKIYYLIRLFFLLLKLLVKLIKIFKNSFFLIFILIITYFF